MIRDTLKTKFGTAKIVDGRYYQITSTKEGNARKLLHRLIWEDFYGEIPEGYVIHHKNGNKQDNCILNLQLMDGKEHLSLHNKGENHPMYGKIISEEHKKKLSKAHAGKTLSESHKKKISESQKGKSHTLETRMKLSNIRAGKKLSEETKKKIGEAQKGEKHYRWGTSIIDEWGGLWFLKEMKKQVGTMKKLQEYTGITMNATYKYLRNRGLKWSEL